MRSFKRQRVDSKSTLLLLSFVMILAHCADGGLDPDPGDFPVAESIVPTFGPPGSQVSVFGRNFGETAADNKVSFAGYKAAILDVIHGDQDEIRAVVPMAVPEGRVQVTVEVGGKVSNPIYFQVTPRNYAVGKSPRSIAAGDFDEDGNLDLATADHDDNRVSVIFGDGSGGFSLPSPHEVGRAPRFVMSADLDEDGHLDLVTANEGDYLSRQTRGNVSALLGDGSGGFAAAVPYSAGDRPISLAMGDFNGDGYPDLVVANEGGAEPESRSGSISILPGNGSGGFFPAVDYAAARQPVCVVAGRFDRDDHPDLVVVDVKGGTVCILHGNGAGAISESVALPDGILPVGVALDDFNVDGRLDLAVAYWGLLGNIRELGGIVILLADGATGFVAVEPPALTHVYLTQVDAVDFNEDGTPDLVAVSFSGSSVVVLEGEGAGEFSAANYVPVGGIPWTMTAGDFNHDGHLDMATANSGGNNVSILLGDGTGIFSKCRGLEVDGEPQTLVTADLDRDGFPELITANAAGVAPLRGNGSVSVIRGLGPGGFAPASRFVTGGWPKAAATGDFDGNGIADVVVVGTREFSPTLGKISVLLGDGSGGFRIRSGLLEGLDPRFVASADFNGDGHPDLATADSGEGGVSILAGDGSGGFSRIQRLSVAWAPWCLAIGDFNTDSIPDLIVGNMGAPIAKNPLGHISVFLGDGAGRFSWFKDIETGEGAVSIATGRFDRDHLLDLAVSDYWGRIHILLGRGGGDFVPSGNYEAGFHPKSIVTGDFNRDAFLDLVWVNWGNEVRILLGDGSGGFEAPEMNFFRVGIEPAALVSDDFDRDGNADLAVLALVCGRVEVLYGDGQGGFFIPVARAP